MIAGRTEHYGPNHVDTLLTKGNLATLLDEKKTPESVEEAERLYKEVIAGESEHYGPNHVNTLTTKGNLANLRWQRGHIDEARDTLRQVVAGYQQQQLSPEHPYLVWAKGALARLESLHE